MSALVKSEAFLQIDQDLLCEILERDQLRSSESEIWNAALRWADEQCRQNDIECSAKNRREILGPALFKIRLPLIPKEEFTESIVSTDVLTAEEVDSIYQQFSHQNLSDLPEHIKLKFPMHQRYKYEDTIKMEIEKVSEFSLEEELMDPSKGLYNKNEDKIKLAIDVIVEEPKTEKFVSDPNKSNGTIEMEIEKLSEFAREITESERTSETLYIKGMPWKILAQIEKKNESTEKWLGFYLSCDASEKDGNWSRKCSSIFRIVSQKSGVGDYKKGELTDEDTFNSEVISRGFINFISFAELMDPSNAFYNREEDKVTLAIDVSCA
ncbi:hypothetical protein niasHT_006350 [Heterodera trifolii]|uniref:MATH domain-containing protein n=1 Tax=Heterodera trifolii TaxID=157864 RepID=A0ABD2M6W0_9BILA